MEVSGHDQRDQGGRELQRSYHLLELGRRGCGMLLFFFFFVSLTVLFVYLFAWGLTRESKDV